MSTLEVESTREAEEPIEPSFLLEVMALDIVEPPFTSYQVEFRSFMATAEEQIGNVWPDPAGLGPDEAPHRLWLHDLQNHFDRWPLARRPKFCEQAPPETHAIQHVRHDDHGHHREAPC